MRVGFQYTDLANSCQGVTHLTLRQKKFLPISVYVLVFAAMLLGCAMLNRSFPVLTGTRGDTMAYQGDELTALHFSQDADGAVIRFYSQIDPAQLAVISCSRSISRVRVNGSMLEFRPFTNMAQSNKMVSLSAIDAQHDPVRGWLLELRLDGSEQVEMYLCDAKTIDNIALVFDLCVPMIYGILLATVFYVCVLYLFNRLKLLLLFSGYVSSVLLWIVLSYLADSPSPLCNALTPVSNSMFNIALITGIICSVAFCMVDRWQRLKLSRKVFLLFAFNIAYNVLNSLLPEQWRIIYRNIVYIAGSATLLICCWRGESIPWLVLIGQALTQALRASMLTGQSVSYYMQLMHMMRLFTMPYIFGCIFQISAISGRKYMEVERLKSKLEESNVRLEQKVRERTAQLEEQQQFRTNLLTNIFHDLRTPLLIMRGCIDGLTEERRRAERIAILDDRLRHITSLTEDLFDVVKLEDKSMLVETEPIAMKPLLSGVVDSLRIEAEKSGISIRAEMEDGLIAWGDEMWLARALQNLICNAVYYSKPENPWVEVRLYRREKNICVAVRDFGAGVLPEEQELIFQRYYRVSGTKKHHSSGLGLSIAMNVAKRHDGTIEIMSTPGKGTLFIFVLPLWRQETN